MASTSENVTQIPPDWVTASEVRMIWETIHGWRPTSVMIQPHSSATIADTPESAQARRNHFVCGMSRLRHQAQPSQAPRPISSVQIPTIVSKHQCNIVLAGGRSSGGTE